MEDLLRKLLTVAFCALAFASCGQNPGPAPVASVAPPAATSAPAAPLPPSIPLSDKPMPAWPDFVTPLLAKSFAESGVTISEGCVGNADTVTTRYQGERAGFGVSGWAWNLVAKKPYTQVLVLNAAGLVQGAGIGGAPRPDVMKARQDVTVENVGWSADAQGPSGEYAIYSYDAAGRTACAVGRIVVP